MTDNYRDLSGTCLLSTLNLYLSFVCGCVCLHMCLWMCFRWPPSRWENAGSLLVCVHMYQTQHVFPFQRRGILYVQMCVVVCECKPMCVFICECQRHRSHWAADFQEPLQQKQALCVSCSHTPLSQDTHTDTYIEHCPILFFPLQVSSTPIPVPPVVKMFLCDCHETCSLVAKQRTQIG